MAQSNLTWQAAIEKIKSTVVFLGTLDEQGKPRISGTGSILQIQGVFHLLTAKHVVVAAPNLVVFFNRKDGAVGSRQIEDVRQKAKVDWVFHSDQSVDLAVIPFGLDIENDDVLAIPDTLFVGLDAIRELDEVFFMSFQPGIETTDRLRPIYRVARLA